MNQVVPMRMETGGLSRRDPRRVTLFRRGPGKDLQGSEVDEALEWCEIYDANPFVKDIYFFVFDAGDALKRRVVPVLGIGLYRKIAAKTGNYMPDENPPVFTYDDDLIGPANPRGIVDCTVRVKVYRHSEWHWVSERIRWDERAPIKATGEGGLEWKDTGQFWPADHPTKAGKPKRKQVPVGETFEQLDPSKPNWKAMGETMHSKCTEAACLRKAFPNEFAGSYVAEEMDWARTIDGTAEDITKQYESEQRGKLLGGPSVTLDFCNNEPLAWVPVGKVHDRIAEWLRDNADKAQMFRDRNVVGLRDYWRHDAAAALAVRKKLEEAMQ